VPADDERALYVGIDAYVAAGGTVMRDLFAGVEPGQGVGEWLETVGLLDRLVAEKLAADADRIRAEGWAWVEAATAIGYGRIARCRSLTGTTMPLDPAEAERLATLRTELETLIDTAVHGEEPDEATAARIAALDGEIAVLTDRPLVYDPAEMTRAGAFISLDVDGSLRIDRGHVRPEDEQPLPVDPPAMPEASASGQGGEPGAAQPLAQPLATVDAVRREPVAAPAAEGGTDEGAGRPLPERLVQELSLARTLSLREAVAADADTARLALLHALCLAVFHPYSSDTCLEIRARATLPLLEAPHLRDLPAVAAMAGRHAAWRERLPVDSGELWPALRRMARPDQDALLAYCVARSLDAVAGSGTRDTPRQVHVDRLAARLGHDMARDWQPTVAGYFGQVTKAQILAAVREACGAEAAQRIETLRKPEMATAAEALLTGTGWLPAMLRLPTAGPTAGPIIPEEGRPEEPVEAGDTEAVPPALAAE
jgi:ParB family chromosome partitioning protein